MSEGGSKNSKSGKGSVEKTVLGGQNKAALSLIKEV